MQNETVMLVVGGDLDYPILRMDEDDGPNELLTALQPTSSGLPTLEAQFLEEPFRRRHVSPHYSNLRCPINQRWRLANV